MTPVQTATIANANARMKPALDLYEERCWLWHLSCRLPLRDLQRLNGILRRLSDTDLKTVATFAEGLAEWSSGDASCPDATLPNRQDAAPPQGPAQAAGG